MAHLPVLLRESVELLAPERGGLFVDATVGLGGHAEALLSRGPAVRLVGIDRDLEALRRAADRLAPFGDRVRLAHGNFHRLEQELAELGVEPGTVAGLLIDLGVSWLQLGTPDRGFSFRLAGPLDMRMGLSELTAADLVNHSAEGDLERIFRDFGEERQARRIARAIVLARGESPITTTAELKRIIDEAKGGGHGPAAAGRAGRGHAGAARREGRVDPATRVFQALRIAVNQELAGLETAMEQAVKMMATDGRLVVISYHSLEDRIVKNSLRDLVQGEVDQVTGRPRAESQLIAALTRKPVRPTPEEVEWNPRARSARLRAARRL
ncbi:MAG TPA: 16S rRNA (cytosine(1402)-N(4))-methyltransferase RsmH [Thermoanaerobaculia bacterium]|nr:16S rRNA (cytosine(1402)-N(4))-methyltransferase RsmH [Thermoanaerobaculia bacterium]